MSDRKAVVKNADMSEDMQQDAVECAAQALEKYNIEKDIAAYIKKVQHATPHPLARCTPPPEVFPPPPPARFPNLVPYPD